MPTLRELYGSQLGLDSAGTGQRQQATDRPLTLKERYGDQINVGPRDYSHLPPKLRELNQAVDAMRAAGPVSGDIDPRQFMNDQQAVPSSTAVDPDIATQQPSRFANPLAILPQGTTEKFMQMMSENPFYGGMFSPPETGRGPVGGIEGVPSIGASQEGSDFGRTARNALRNLVQFIPEQALGALEDPVAAGRGLIEFAPHVAGQAAQAAGMGYGQPPEVSFEALEAMKERPLDVALLAVPFALAGLKAAARGGGAMSAGARTKIIRQIEKAREAGATEQQIRNIIDNDALVTHALRRLDAEVPQRVTGEPGSASRIKGNIEQSRRAREAARPDFDRGPLSQLDEALQADRSARSAAQEAAKEAGRDYVRPKSDPLVEIEKQAAKRDPALLDELVELGHDPAKVAAMTPDELAYYGSGGRIGKLTEPAKPAVPAQSPEIRTETPRPATKAPEVAPEVAKTEKPAEAPVARPEAGPKAKAKEPWEMTKQEFIERQHDLGHGNYVDPEMMGDGHRFQVERAVSEGRPVPPAVLKNYPDLAKQAGKTKAVESPKAIPPDPAAPTVEAPALKVEKAKSPAKITPEIIAEAEKTPVKAPTEAPKPGRDVVGQKNAELEKVRKEVGLDKMPETERVKIDAPLIEAKAAGYDKSAIEIADNILKRNRPATAAEVAGMGIRIVELRNEYRLHRDAANKAWGGGNKAQGDVLYKLAEKAMDDIETLTRASKRTASMQGLGLRYRQTFLDAETLDLASVIQEVRMRNRGKINAAKEKAYEDLVKAYEQRQSELVRLQLEVDKLTRRELERKVEVQIRRDQRRVRVSSRLGRTIEKIDLDIEATKAKLRDLGYRVNDITGVTAEGAYYISKLAYYYTEKGVVRFGELLTKLKSDFPDVSESDILASILNRDARKVRKARTEAQKRFDTIKREARLMDEIRKLEEGTLDLPKEKVAAPEHIRQLQDKLRQLRKDATRTVREGQLLENAHQTINELQDMLDNQYRRIKEKKPVLPEDRAAAKEKIKQLRKHLRIEDTLADLSEQLRTGDFKVKPKVEPPTVPTAILRKQVEIDVARRRIRSKLAEEGPKNVVRESINTLRTLKATADMSATLRQGLLLSIMRPGQVPRSFARSVKATFSEFDAVKTDNAIRSHPEHYVREMSKLELSEIGGKLTRGEENFMSNWAEKIPGYKQVVKASERHMTTYLNLMRVEMFDWFRSKYPNATAAELRAWADFVNVSSGRGNLRGTLGTDIGSLAFFAPRFAISRLEYPVAILKHWREPRVRKHIAESYVRLAGLGMASMKMLEMAGAEVGTNPRESDFMKVRIGDTRFDMWAGLQQPIRLVARLGLGAADQKGITGEWLSDADKKMEPIELMLRFVTYKLSPGFTLGSEIYTGKSMVGEDRSPLETVARIPAPLILESIIEAWKHEGPALGIAAGGAEFFGMGVNTYEDSQSRVRRDIRWLKYQGKHAEANQKLSEWNRNNPGKKISSDWFIKLPVKGK